jgi:hypothetical protein
MPTAKALAPKKAKPTSKTATRATTKAAPKKAAAKNAAPKNAAAPKTAAPSRATAKRADLNAPIEGYVGKLTGEHRAIADKLTSIVKKTIPEVTTGLKWGMPVFSLGGEMLCYFRSQKNDVRFGLSYVKGVELDDPDGRFYGSSEDGRHVKFKTAKEIDPTRVAGWLRALAASRA